MIPFALLKKNLKKDYSGFKNISVALLADSASQFLHIALKGYGYERKINYNIYEAEYNQIDLEINNPGSGLYEAGADFIVVNKCTEHLLTSFYKLTSTEQSAFADKVLESFTMSCNAILNKTNAKIILNTFPEINDAVFGNYASKTNQSFVFQLRKINLGLMQLAQDTKNVFVCDQASIYHEMGYKTCFDPKMYLNADMVYSLNVLPYIAKSVTDIISSVSGDIKKCLILDLDNTLWGGVIGDDGIDGIQLGYYGIGKAYTELQLWIKQLKLRGIILAVCSKNTEHIAKEPFESHPDMILRLEDIAVFAANWETKVDNIRHIQQVLNIGFDSMVFLDDNPFEREIIKTSIPHITVPELPEDPAEYLIYLRALNLFETASFTTDDKMRTQQYQEEAKRQSLLLTFENEDDFLQSLNMTSEVDSFNDFTIPRVAQLTQRSNQFNLRTIRYTDNDIRQISGSDDYLTLSFTLDDKFGSHGLTALVILKKERQDTLFIDTWIMSCRILKRGMEDFTLNHLVQLARYHSIDYLKGEYIPTAKNGIVKDHYSALGFEYDGKYWTLNCSNYTNRKTFIKNSKHGVESNIAGS